jgi:uncharacterized circularly permuted ATP-grasp superfamily protein
LLQSGITFNVYGDNAAMEKIFPFDVIPRIVEASEWDWIEKGLKQRVYALNLFIDDIYHQQKIVRDKVVPEYLIRSARSFREACVGLNPPQLSMSFFIRAAATGLSSIATKKKICSMPPAGGRSACAHRSTSCPMNGSSGRFPV